MYNSYFCKVKLLPSRYIRLIWCYRSASTCFSYFRAIYVQRYWPWSQSRYKCVTRGGKGRGLHCPFPEIGKKCPNFLGEMPWCQTSMIKFLNSSAIFKSFQAKKLKIYPCRAFIFSTVDCSALIPRKLPCPKKVLVACLRYLALMTLL